MKKCMAVTLSILFSTFLLGCSGAKPTAYSVDDLAGSSWEYAEDYIKIVDKEFASILSDATLCFENNDTYYIDFGPSVSPEASLEHGSYSVEGDSVFLYPDNTDIFPNKSYQISDDGSTFFYTEETTFTIGIIDVFERLNE